MGGGQSTRKPPAEVVAAPAEAVAANHSHFITHQPAASHSSRVAVNLPASQDPPTQPLRSSPINPNQITSSPQKRQRSRDASPSPGARRRTSIDDYIDDLDIDAHEPLLVRHLRSKSPMPGSPAEAVNQRSESPGTFVISGPFVQHTKIQIVQPASHVFLSTSPRPHERSHPNGSSHANGNSGDGARSQGGVAVATAGRSKLVPAPAKEPIMPVDEFRRVSGGHGASQHEPLISFDNDRFRMANNALLNGVDPLQNHRAPLKDIARPLQKTVGDPSNVTPPKKIINPEDERYLDDLLKEMG